MSCSHTTHCTCVVVVVFLVFDSFLSVGLICHRVPHVLPFQQLGFANIASRPIIMETCKEFGVLLLLFGLVVWWFGSLVRVVGCCLVLDARRLFFVVRCGCGCGCGCGGGSFVCSFFSFVHLFVCAVCWVLGAVCFTVVSLRRVVPCCVVVVVVVVCRCVSLCVVVCRCLGNACICYRRTSAKAFANDVFIDQERRLGD